MKRSPNGPRYRPADLSDPDAAHDALLHWDHEDEQILRLLAESPEHRGRLTILRRADGWLRAHAAKTIAQRSESGGHAEPGPDPLACPSAEELYDFGQGPGAGPLDPERRAEIDRHLAACLPCDQLVATLATPPPVPLLLGEPEAEEGAAPPAGPARDRIHRFPRFGLLIAAAAGLVFAVGVWRAWNTETRAAWPAEPQLRGQAPEALIFPRDRVLERTPELAGLSPAWEGTMPFEVLAPKAGSEVRIELFRTAGGAFDQPEAVADWTQTAQVGIDPGAAPLASGPKALAAGHYTWKAWTREHGLDVELGSRDFEVVTDEALTRELAALLASGQDDDRVRAVRLLHDRGYRTDARALAWRLPRSGERDAYLGRVPGR